MNTYVHRELDNVMQNKQQGNVQQGKDSKQQAAVKQNPAIIDEDGKIPLMQQQDILTRTMESKTLEKKTFDRIHAYLSAAQKDSAKQEALQKEAEQDHAALVRVAALQRHTHAFPHLLLPVQGHGVHILLHQHIGDDGSRGIAVRQQGRWQDRLEHL